MAFLLDTCIVSELSKKRPNSSFLAGRIVEFDKGMAVEWGRIMGTSMRVGRSRPEVDMLIAATAKKRWLTLVTRNVKDMENVGVQLLNPFD